MGRYFSDDALCVLSPLVGLARSLESESVVKEGVTSLLLRAVKCVSDGVFTASSREELTNELSEAKKKTVPSCFVCAHPCGHNDDYPAARLSDLDNREVEEIFALLSKIISEEGIPVEKKRELALKSIIYISSDFGDEYMQSLIDSLRTYL